MAVVTGGLSLAVVAVKRAGVAGIKCGATSLKGGCAGEVDRAGANVLDGKAILRDHVARIDLERSALKLEGRTGLNGDGALLGGGGVGDLESALGDGKGAGGQGLAVQVQAVVAADLATVAGNRVEQLEDCTGISLCIEESVGKVGCRIEGGGADVDDDGCSAGREGRAVNRCGPGVVGFKCILGGRSVIVERAGEGAVQLRGVLFDHERGIEGGRGADAGRSRIGLVEVGGEGDRRCAVAYDGTGVFCACDKTRAQAVGDLAHSGAVGSTDDAADLFACSGTHGAEVCTVQDLDKAGVAGGEADDAAHGVCKVAADDGALVGAVQNISAVGEADDAAHLATVAAHDSAVDTAVDLRGVVGSTVGRADNAADKEAARDVTAAHNNVLEGSDRANVTKQADESAGDVNVKTGDRVTVAVVEAGEDLVIGIADRSKGLGVSGFAGGVLEIAVCCESAVV